MEKKVLYLRKTTFLVLQDLKSKQTVHNFFGEKFPLYYLCAYCLCLTYLLSTISLINTAASVVVFSG